MKPINTAILSYGMSGEIFHAPLLEAHTGFTLSTIVQRSSSSAKTRYPNVNIVKSVDEVMEDESIELVVVNTPNETHFPFTTRALEAGKHVIVEKPFSVTTKEADGMIAVGKKTGKILSVFQNRRWDGDFMTVRKVVEAKWLGNWRSLNCTMTVIGIISKPTHGRRNRHRAREYFIIWGHICWTRCSCYLASPQSVDARMGIQRPGGRVDDYYDIRLQYDGFNAIVKSSYLVREPGPRYILHGTEGSFIKYGLDPQEQALKEGRTPGNTSWGYEPRELWGKLNANVGSLHFEGTVETDRGNYLGYYDNIYEVIRTGKGLIVKPEESRDGILIIEACIESNRLRKAIAIP